MKSLKDCEASFAGSAILVHGFGDGPESFARLEPELAKRGIRSVCPQILVPEGTVCGSFSPLEDAVRSVQAHVPDKLKGRALLIGHSYGALVATRLSHKLGGGFPLIAIEPPWVKGKLGLLLACANAEVDVVEVTCPRAIEENAFAYPHPYAHAMRVRRMSPALRLAAAREVIASYPSKASPSESSMLEEFLELPVRKLVILDSATASPMLTRRLSSANVAIAAFDRCSHWPHWTDASGIAKQISSFQG